MPVQITTEPADSPVLKEQPEHIGRCLSVLVADDEPINVKLLSVLLRRKGYQVTACSDGASAVEILQDKQFDVVLMDIQMPRMDGIEATRLIRRLERGSGRCVPIVAVTAWETAENRLECHEAGMNAFLSKPISAGELMEVVVSLAG